MRNGSVVRLLHLRSLRGFILSRVMAALIVTATVPGTSFALNVPILLYHRFGPRVGSSMTVTTEAFERQLQQLEQAGCRVIPLRLVVEHLVANGPPPSPHSVAITVDDGHRSVYTELLPVVLRHRIPITLFVYPSAISNAPYAMTWQQLHELQATGLFDIQSHTYWHPNFRREKQRLSPDAYARFVDLQFIKSKRILEAHTGKPVDLLAWPFGLHDRELEKRASAAGYVAAFTMEREPARSGNDPMAIPRYLITGEVSSRTFATIVGTPIPGANGEPR